MQQTKLTPLLLALLGACSAPSWVDAKPVSGALTMSIDATALASIQNAANGTPKTLNMYVEDFIDQTYNQQAITGSTPDPHPGLTHADRVNMQSFPFTVNSNTETLKYPAPINRFIQATTMDTANVSTGQIGLSGVLRLRSSTFALDQNPALVPPLNTYLVAVDFALSFDGTRWHLDTNDYQFGVFSMFELVNVQQAVDTNGDLTLSGDLTLGNSSWSKLLFHAPDAQKSLVVGKVKLQPGVPVVDNVTFDAATGVARFVDVQVQDQHWQVELQLQANNTFTLKSANPLTGSLHAQPAIYDAASQTVQIPKVSAFGKSYQAALKDTGNFTFTLSQFSEL